MSSLALQLVLTESAKNARYLYSPEAGLRYRVTQTAPQATHTPVPSPSSTATANSAQPQTTDWRVVWRGAVNSATANNPTEPPTTTPTVPSATSQPVASHTTTGSMTNSSNSELQTSSLQNPAAWSIVREFAKNKSSMTLPEAEEHLQALLGSGYLEGDWRAALKAVMDVENVETVALEAVGALEANAMLIRSSHSATPPATQISRDSTTAIHHEVDLEATDESSGQWTGSGDTPEPVVIPAENLKPQTERRSRDPLISWEAVWLFSTSTLSRKFKKHTPITWSIFTNFVGSDGAATIPDSDTTTYRYRPKELVISSCISQLLYSRSSWVNFWPLCTESIAHFGMKAHHAMYRVGSRLTQCAPFEATQHVLVTMSHQARGSFRLGLGLLSARKPYWVVLDNTQMYHNRRDQRIGSKNKMVIGTGATSIQMEDCVPEDFNLDKLLEKTCQGRRRGLTVQQVLDNIDLDHFDTVLRFHFITTLVTFVPVLDTAYGAEPLGTNGHNETTIKGMLAALKDFASQLGVTAFTLGRQFMFFSGDGKSVETMHTIKRYLSGSENPSDFESLRFIRPVLEIWDTRWTDLNGA